MAEDLRVCALEVLHVGHSPVLHLDLDEIALVGGTSNLVGGPIIELLERLSSHGALCIVSEVMD